MMKANTFIVGAPKAGTTSLHYYLSQHHDVCMSSLKEPNFFSFEEVSSLFYKATSISNSTAYHKLFDEEKKVIGEASVSYLFYENVPKRIFEYNSKSNIVILLRHPVDRAISHYLMDYRLGYCSCTLEEIVYNKDKYPLFFQQYVELGLYYKQVKRYLDTFGRERVHILFYSDFKNDTEAAIRDLFHFLKLENTSVDFSVQNSFMKPTNAVVSYLYSLSWVRKGIKNIIPTKAVEAVKRRFFSKQNKPDFADSLMAQLSAYYLPDITRLESLLNVNLTSWKNN